MNMDEVVGRNRDDIGMNVEGVIETHSITAEHVPTNEDKRYTTVYIDSMVLHT